MQQDYLQKLYQNKQTGKRFPLFALAFLALFFVSQLTLSLHQLSHDNSDLSSSCTLCLSSSDSIHEYVVDVSIDAELSFLRYQQNIQTHAYTHVNSNYSPRAPPVSIC